MIEITGVAHVGVRVIDADRAIAFYEKLGFAVTHRGGDEPVVILQNPAGVEINLIVNAESDFDGANVLMDAAVKRPGWTHVALSVASLESSVAALAAAGVGLSGGPIRLGNGTSAFVRDPDANVVELRETDRSPGSRSGA